MISAVRRVVACVAATVAACLGVAGAAAQVPTVEPPPESSTTVPASEPPTEAPAPAPPPEDAPSHVLDPAGAPAPAAPGTPGDGSPSSATSTTRPARNPLPPARAATSGASPLSIDLSEFADLRRQAVGNGPRTAQRDSGFDSSLPFQPGAAGQLAEPGAEPIELGAEEERIAKVRSASAIAGGFLALVLVGIAVWVLQQARPDAQSGARP